MSGEHNSVDQAHPELDHAELDEVVGGDSGDYLVWRKNFGAAGSSQGAMILPEVGWEVIVEFESGDRER